MRMRQQNAVNLARRQWEIHIIIQVVALFQAVIHQNLIAVRRQKRRGPGNLMCRTQESNLQVTALLCHRPDSIISLLEENDNSALLRQRNGLTSFCGNDIIKSESDAER